VVTQSRIRLRNPDTGIHVTYYGHVTMLDNAAHYSRCDINLTNDHRKWMDNSYRMTLLHYNFQHSHSDVTVSDINDNTRIGVTKDICVHTNIR